MLIGFAIYWRRSEADFQGISHGTYYLVMGCPGLNADIDYQISTFPAIPRSGHLLAQMISEIDDRTDYKNFK